MNQFELLKPGCFYHIYNRANNQDLLFIEEKNYPYFLSLLRKHLMNYIDFYGYSLMENHFHFLIKVKSEIQLKRKKSIKQLRNRTIGKFISRRFSDCFNAYAKSINKAYNRTGSLFEERFKRKIISDQTKLKAVLLYIHANPQKHGFTKKFTHYRHSSYRALLTADTTFLLQTEAVMKWFGGKSKYIRQHLIYNYQMINDDVLLMQPRDD